MEEFEQEKKIEKSKSLIGDLLSQLKDDDNFRDTVTGPDFQLPVIFDPHGNVSDDKIEEFIVRNSEFIIQKIVKKIEETTNSPLVTSELIEALSKLVDANNNSMKNLVAIYSEKKKEKKQDTDWERKEKLIKLKEGLTLKRALAIEDKKKEGAKNQEDSLSVVATRKEVLKALYDKELEKERSKDNEMEAEILERDSS